MTIDRLALDAFAALGEALREFRLSNRAPAALLTAGGTEANALLLEDRVTAVATLGARVTLTRTTLGVPIRFLARALQCRNRWLAGQLR